MNNDEEDIELIDHNNINLKDNINDNSDINSSGQSNTNILVITIIKDSIKNSLEQMKTEVRLKMIATNSLRFK